MTCLQMGVQTHLTQTWSEQLLSINCLQAGLVLQVQHGIAASCSAEHQSHPVG
jgi:hypothetical protein